MKISKIIQTLAIGAACTASLTLTSCGGSSSSSSSSETNNELLEPFTMTALASNIAITMTPTTLTEGSASFISENEEGLSETFNGSYVWTTPPSAESHEAVIRFRFDSEEGAPSIVWEISLEFSSDTEAFGEFRIWPLTEEGELGEEIPGITSDFLFSRKLY